MKKSESANGREKSGAADWSPLLRMIGNDGLGPRVALDQLLHVHCPVVLLDATMQQREDRSDQKEEERKVPASVLKTGWEAN